jgi:hypothetical protein
MRRQPLVTPLRAADPNQPCEKIRTIRDTETQRHTETHRDRETQRDTEQDRVKISQRLQTNKQTDRQTDNGREDEYVQNHNPSSKSDGTQHWHVQPVVVSCVPVLIGSSVAVPPLLGQLHSSCYPSP